MATQTTTLAIRLLNDNDPNAIHPDNPEAAANIMALARLAAYKAFCEVGVWHENRARHYEDAIQEAAASIWQYADRGLRRAYVIASSRLNREAEAEYQLGDTICMAGETTNCLREAKWLPNVAPNRPKLRCLRLGLAGK